MKTIRVVRRREKGQCWRRYQLYSPLIGTHLSFLMLRLGRTSRGPLMYRKRRSSPGNFWSICTKKVPSFVEVEFSWM